MITVTQSHQYILSFSKFTPELALEVPLADQTTSRIVVELGKNVNMRNSG